MPLIKRFDETTGDGEQTQTLFTTNRRIERQINHLNKSGIADIINFNTISGADEHLDEDVSEILDIGRSLSSVFEDDPDDHPSGMGIVGRTRRAEKTAKVLGALTNLPKAA